MKLQLNRMLAPLWELPIFRRGVLALSADEVNGVFDPGCTTAFEQIVGNRISRMTAPFFGRRQKSTLDRNSEQTPPAKTNDRLLPGFDHE